MHHTVFDTPVVKSFMHFFAVVTLKLSGWKVKGNMPAVPKFVAIAVPHTSNWDFFYTILAIFAMRGKIYWMGKDKIFRKPFTGMFRWLGGIPVDRSKSNNLVQQTIEQFNSHDELAITIPPTGTRKKVMRWKTGFYYIAIGANVPVVLAFMDYSRKVTGFGPVFYPTGDIDADLKEISIFYRGMKGKNDVMDELGSFHSRMASEMMTQEIPAVNP